MRTTTLITAIAAIGCGTDFMPPADARVPHAQVLFVGNSLTYTNGLPATVRAIAASAGDTIAVAMAAAPNLALVDHLTGGSNALQQLHDGRWDVVILQQGPTSMPGICRDSMILWTRMFDSLIRPTGGRTALFMTWPMLSQGDVWSGVRTSYLLSAKAVGGIFLPAGEAWRIALAGHPGLPLYGGDGFHPTPMGSYLAALEIFERLSGRDARTLPPQAFSNGLALPMAADTIRWLQQAAHEATASQAAAAPALPAPPAASRPPTSTSC